MPDSGAVGYWVRLRRANEVDNDLEISSIASPIDSGYGRIRYALGPNGEPRLLVPCASATRLSGNSAQKLDVAVTSLQLNGRTTWFIDVMCLDLRLEPVFGELADEVLRRIQAGTSPANAVAGGINDFRDLLREGATTDVATQVLIGLIGELVVLRRLCQKHPEAALYWMGPEDERHDFRRGNNAFEVKTSSRADRKVVTIHGVEQLSPPQDGTLILVHVQVERTADGKVSVAGLVETLLGLGADPRALQNRLAELGCSGHTAPEWNQLTFNLERLSAYNVVDGFPRIIGTTFLGGAGPLGISNISYDLDLDLAQPFKLGEDNFNGAIERFLA